VVVFFAHALIVLAAWTVAIKYLFPLGYALAYGLPPLAHVTWDAWPLVHLWLAWALLRRPAYLVPLALAVSAAEVAIVAVKFAVFLDAPEWTIWTTNWFVNKAFVLLLFAALLPYVWVNRRRLAG